MTRSDSGDITQLLHQVEQGDTEAQNRLAQLVRANLKRIAANRLRRERPDHLYQTSDLVQEAYLRLFRIRDIQWEGREHFFKVAAVQMRRILVDYARRERPEGHDNLALEDVPGLTVNADPSILEVNRLLDSLAEIDPRRAEIVQLRYFGGCKIEEIAEITKIPLGTVKRHWASAKAFFKLQLGAAAQLRNARHDSATLVD